VEYREGAVINGEVALIDMKDSINTTNFIIESWQMTLVTGGRRYSDGAGFSDMIIVDL
jgi:hypothetical protein